MRVVISDSATRQHWLADGASVVLHLCRAWLSKVHRDYDSESPSVTLWRPQGAGSPSNSRATLTSIENRGIKLYVSHFKDSDKAATSGSNRSVPVAKDWYFLQDLAHRFFNWIEQIRDRASAVRHSSDIDLLKQGSNLIGFEFLDMMRGDSRLEPYVFELDSTAGAWLPYARKTDAVHIFGAGFGELIKPRMSSPKSLIVCRQQSSVPRDADYLIAPLSVLKEGMERFRHTTTCAQLWHGLYWRDAGKVFEPCTCQCSRSSAGCTSLVRNLHGRCLEKPGARTPTCLPQVFTQWPTGAILLGYEPQLLTKNPRASDNSVAKPLDSSSRQHGGTSEGTHHQKRLPSDSGYASNVGSSSRDSQSSSLTLEERPSQEFKIRGAASEPEGKKLTKRRKTAH